MPKLNYRAVGFKALSHSRMDVARQCWLKWSLLHGHELSQRTKSRTFSYGHGFGHGIQCMLAGGTLEEAVFEVFRNWDTSFVHDGFESEMRNKKDYFELLEALEIFDRIRRNECDLTDFGNTRRIDWTEWEVAQWEDDEGNIKPAVEIELVIELGDGFLYEGHIDIIIKRKGADEFAVVELKTSGLTNIHEAIYGNSPQPLGYMMALDAHLVKANPDAVTNFSVIYLVLQTKSKRFYEFEFLKSPLHRNSFIAELISFKNFVMLNLENDMDFSPNYTGCFKYNQPCKFYGTCHLPTSNLIQMFRPESQDDSQFELDDSEPDIRVTLIELIERQLELLESVDIIQTDNQIVTDIDLEDYGTDGQLQFKTKEEKFFAELDMFSM